MTTNNKDIINDITFGGNKNYVLACNDKAISWFKEHGYKVSKPTIIDTFWYDDCNGNDIYYNERSVVYINTNLSGRAFHKLLVENNLLLNK